MPVTLVIDDSLLQRLLEHLAFAEDHAKQRALSSAYTGNSKVVEHFERKAQQIRDDANDLQAAVNS